MKKFQFRGTVTISVSTEVMAKNLKEAMELANDRPLIELCHQCSDGNPKEYWVTSGELDGEVVDIEVEE